MISYLRNRLALISGLSGVVLALVFLALVTRMAQELREEVRAKMTGRAASVLQPMVQRQYERRLAEAPGLPASMQLVSALLGRAAQDGILAMAIFDAEGRPLESVPAGPQFVDLPAEDFFRASLGAPISRYEESYSLLLLGGTGTEKAPVQELIIPVRQGTEPEAEVVGFVRYHLDARQLSTELALINEQIGHQSRVTLGLGLVAVAVVTLAAQIALRRSHRQLQERNAQLVRTQIELTLAAKTSAMGQVTSHLMHALKGAVAGLRASARPGEAPDLAGVAEYTARVEHMIRDTLEILGDLSGNASYQLPSSELLRGIRERNADIASARGVKLLAEDKLGTDLDNHRGSLLCLIANNLIQNALEASPAGAQVHAVLAHGEGGNVVLSVRDEAGGIAPAVRARLFEPGASTREGGSGLGLALSRLLARQMNGELALVSGGPDGSVFEVRIPLR